MAHVSPEKKEVVKKILKLFADYPIVGSVDMENLPGPQLQTMKAKLRGKVEIVMTKRRLMKVAIEEIKDKVKGSEELVPHLIGMPALLFTKENP
ncbi:50S ribosomal protein L10, partial [Nanoarchaeota archaeon]